MTTQPMVTQPPDLLVHSGNWQEHSFDSSVVTEGHYDASFESEVPPMGLSMDKENNGTTIIGGGPTTTSGNSMGNSLAVSTSAMVTSAPVALLAGKQPLIPKTRPPKIAQTAKKSVFSVSGLADRRLSACPETGTATGDASIGGRPRSSSVAAAKPNSLMLWKKVQHLVVVGGAVVGGTTPTSTTSTSAPEATTSGPTATSTTALSVTSNAVQQSKLKNGGPLSIA